MRDDNNDYRQGWYTPNDDHAHNLESQPENDSQTPYHPYRPADFHTPQPPSHSAGHFSDPEDMPWEYTAKKKKRTFSMTTKAVMLTISVLILIIASAMVFMTTDQTTGPVIQGPAIDQGDGDSFGSGSNGDRTWNLPDDYYSYFDEYYSSQSSGQISIRRYTDTDGFEFSVKSARGRELTLQEVYEQCNSAVVGITATSSGYEYSWGSGVLVSADGYILTNAHIIDGCDGVVVTLWDDKSYDGWLVGYDTQSDVALLKIDVTNAPYAEIGDSSLMQVGDTVVAIGNPLGEDFRGTMTNGIISAINRNVTYGGHTMTLMQTNAAINEGNSGGPLINMYGQVIGITNMKVMSTYTSTVEGIGFAIPTNVIKEIIDELLDRGYIQGRPGIGLTCGSIPASVKEYYNLPDGLYVNAVNEASDAYAKGIRRGDVITKVNGIPVTTTDEVNQIKDQYEVGDAIEFEVYRNSEYFTVEVELMDMNDIYG